MKKNNPANRQAKTAAEEARRTRREEIRLFDHRGQPDAPSGYTTQRPTPVRIVDPPRTGRGGQIDTRVRRRPIDPRDIRRRNKRRRLHPGLRVFAVFSLMILVILLVLGGIGYGVWRHLIGLVNTPGTTTHLSGVVPPPSYTTLPLTHPVPSFSGIRHILLLGVDDRRELDGETYNNSDVLMILTVDMDDKVIKLTSLQRDLAVHFPDRVAPVKLADTYALGGPAAVIQALNENFRLSLADYVSVNIHEAERLIDIVGGVELYVDVSDNTHFVMHINECIGNQNAWFPERGQSAYLTQGGMQHLDGRQAVAYARVRHGSSDYRRMARQRVVMQAVFDAFLRAGLGSKYRMVEEGMKCIYTSLSADEISKLALQVLQSMSAEIRQKQVPDPLRYNIEFYETTDFLIRADLNAIIPGLYGFLYNDATLAFDPVRPIPGAPGSGLPLPSGVWRQEDQPVATTTTATQAASAPTAAPTAAQTAAQTATQPVDGAADALAEEAAPQAG